MPQDIAETDRIEADIARTRARMDDRLDQLQEHLSPKQMVNDAFAYFRGGAGADITQDLFSRARANPIPIALVGVGLAWLMATSVKGGDPHLSHDMDRGSVASGMTDVLTDHSTPTEPTFNQETHIMAHSTRETLSSLVSNPFALGAIAAVVGAVAGALIPTFEQEEATLGAAATKIREKGRDLAQGAVDTGSRIALETLDAAKESAGAHGLTAEKPVGDVLADFKSGDFISDVKAVAQDTLQAGQETAHNHLAGEAAKEPTATDV